MNHGSWRSWAKGNLRRKYQGKEDCFHLLDESCDDDVKYAVKRLECDLKPMAYTILIVNYIWVYSFQLFKIYRNLVTVRRDACV